MALQNNEHDQQQKRCYLNFKSSLLGAEVWSGDGIDLIYPLLFRRPQKLLPSSLLSCICDHRQCNCFDLRPVQDNINSHIGLVGAEIWSEVGRGPIKPATWRFWPLLLRPSLLSCIWGITVDTIYIDQRPVKNVSSCIAIGEHKGV